MPPRGVWQMRCVRSPTLKCVLYDFFEYCATSEAFAAVAEVMERCQSTTTLGFWLVFKSDRADLTAEALENKGETELR